MLEYLFFKSKIYLNLFFFCIFTSQAFASGELNTDHLNIQLPEGFQIQAIAKLNDKPRMMTFDESGNLFVTSANRNAIYMIANPSEAKTLIQPMLISDNLNAPNGLVFVGNDLLVANQDGVVKLVKKDGVWQKPTLFIRNLATGHHTLKTIKIGPDNHLYLNVGSSCNVCSEEDATRATILRYTIDGKPAGNLQIVGMHSNLPPIWATGLRNSQGFAWHPKTGEMFATNNGADMRSGTKNGKINDEIPPEHLNKIEPGKNYGWPYCWSAANHEMMVEDPNFPGPDNFCKVSTPPAITFTSHSTPIGITFLDKSKFPTEYQSDAIVALHGSWNREQLSGYKLVRVKFDGNKPTEVIDFAKGWLIKNQAWGRPVDVAIGPDGNLYVSDDRAGFIFRIRYTL